MVIRRPVCFFCAVYMNILIKSSSLYETGRDGYHYKEESLQWVEALLDYYMGKVQADGTVLFPGHAYLFALE
jgi:hypothetical protein